MNLFTACCCELNCCKILVHVQVIMTVIKVTGALSWLAIVLIAITKERPASKHPYVLNRGYFTACAALAGALLTAFAAVCGRSLCRLRAALLQRTPWSLRRRRALQSAYLRAAAMLVMLTTWLVNASLRGSAAQLSCAPSAVVAVCECLHWTAWNCIMLFLLIDAHGLVLRRTAARPDGQVRDLPWRWHWPKLILWGANQGARAACCWPAITCAASIDRVTNAASTAALRPAVDAAYARVQHDHSVCPTVLTLWIMAYACIARVQPAVLCRCSDLGARKATQQHARHSHRQRI